MGQRLGAIQRITNKFGFGVHREFLLYAIVRFHYNIMHVLCKVVDIVGLRVILRNSFFLLQNVLY